MTIIFEDNKPRGITKPEEFTFTAKSNQIYLVDGSLERLERLFDSDDVKVTIDGEVRRSYRSLYRTGKSCRKM